jgi:hypothetical protein
MACDYNVESRIYCRTCGDVAIGKEQFKECFCIGIEGAEVYQWTSIPGRN